MTYTVVVTERAARDLEEATVWWARERSAEQAYRWYAKIRKKSTRLLSFLSDAASRWNHPIFLTSCANCILAFVQGRLIECYSPSPEPPWLC